MWASCATAPRCRVPLKCLPPMPDLYPFLLLPIFDERPWGVRDLRPIYTKIVKEPIGESWLTWGDSCIANGPFAGRTLGEIAREYRRDLVGSAAVYEDRFPLLASRSSPGSDRAERPRNPPAAPRRRGSSPPHPQDSLRQTGIDLSRPAWSSDEGATGPRFKWLSTGAVSSAG